jgi:hypothetical protein
MICFNQTGINKKEVEAEASTSKEFGVSHRIGYDGSMATFIHKR